MINKSLDNITNYTRLLSYFSPVLIHAVFGSHTVKLYLSRNQFVLSTVDTTYSDGDRYMPARAIADALNSYLPGIKNVLVLGTGLGSIVRVLHNRGCDPVFTLVENDSTVLQWAEAIFEKEGIGGINPVCEDALKYMEQNTSKFDLIFVDVFIGRKVPAWVTSENFLNLCINSLSTNGHLALNYMINDLSEWNGVKQLFMDLFKNHREIDLGENRILIV